MSKPRRILCVPEEFLIGAIQELQVLGDDIVGYVRHPISELELVVRKKLTLIKVF